MINFALYTVGRSWLDVGSLFSWLHLVHIFLGCWEFASKLNFGNGFYNCQTSPNQVQFSFKNIHEMYIGHILLPVYF
jgi:hypothetical protein